MARKRYGSPPEFHRKHARESAHNARWYLKEARRQTSARNCDAALDALVTANRMSAVMTMERRAAGQRAMFQASTLRHAMRRFAKVCVR